MLRFIKTKFHGNICRMPRLREAFFFTASLILLLTPSAAVSQWYPPAIEVNSNTLYPRIGHPEIYGQEGSYSVRIRKDGSNYVVESINPPSSTSYTSIGTYNPATYTFSTTPAITAKDPHQPAWPASMNEGGPPAVSVNGVLWSKTNTSQYDVYSGPNGETLTISGTNFSIAANGSSLDGKTGSYLNSTFQELNTPVDIRNLTGNGSIIYKVEKPLFGPPAYSTTVYYQTTLWNYQGTVSSGGVTMDVYVGKLGERICIGEDWYTSEFINNPELNESGSFNGLIRSSVLADIKPINIDNHSGLVEVTTLMVGGQIWQPYAKIDDHIYYSSGPGKVLRASSEHIGPANLIDQGNNLNLTGANGYASLQGVSISKEYNITPVYTAPKNGKLVYYLGDSPSNKYVYQSSRVWGNEENSVMVEKFRGDKYISTNDPSSYFELTWQAGSPTTDDNAKIYGNMLPYGIKQPASLINPLSGNASFELVGFNFVYQLGFSYQYLYDSTEYFVEYFSSGEDGFVKAEGSYEIGGIAGKTPHDQLISGQRNDGVLNCSLEEPSPRLYPSPGSPSSLWIAGIKYDFSHGYSQETDYNSFPHTDYFDHYKSSDGGRIFITHAYTQDPENYYSYLPYTTLIGSHPNLGAFYGANESTSSRFPILFSAKTMLAPTLTPSTLYINGLMLQFVSGTFNASGVIEDTYTGSGYTLTITSSSNSNVHSVLVTTSSSTYSGTYSSEIFSVSGIHISGGQITPSFGPPAIWVNGNLLVLSSNINGDSYINSAGDLLTITENGTGGYAVSIVAPSLNINSTTGSYENGIFVVGDLDIRPRNNDGSFFQPTSPPVQGAPSAFWVHGVIWRHQGSSVSKGNLYVGPEAGQLLWLKDQTATLRHDALSINNVSVTYAEIQTTIPNQSGVSVNIVAVANGAFSPAPAQGNPPAVWFKGDLMVHIGGTGGYDYYSSATSGKIFSISLNNQGSVYHSEENPVESGGVHISPLFFMISGSDVRPRNADGTFFTPLTEPLHGPGAVLVTGSTYPWKYQGTAEYNNHTYDQYVGTLVGQIIWINESGQVSGHDSSNNQNITGYYANSTFSNVNGAILTAVNEDGTPTGPRYAPNSVQINQQPWTFSHSSGDTDYYKGPAQGQTLSIGPQGQVVYTNPTLGITNRIGSYSNGVFQGLHNESPPPGGSGTIGGDLDIKGNILSLGSWINDPLTAGLTLSYADISTGHASISMTSSRSHTDWLWYRADDENQGLTKKVMQIDEQHRLNLYSPSGESTPQIVLDPQGVSHIRGAIRIEPQGDLDMGEFTVSPQVNP